MEYFVVRRKHVKLLPSHAAYEPIILQYGKHSLFLRFPSVSFFPLHFPDCCSFPAPWQKAVVCLHLPALCSVGKHGDICCAALVAEHHSCEHERCSICAEIHHCHKVCFFFINYLYLHLDPPFATNTDPICLWILLTSGKIIDALTVLFYTE